MTRLQALLSHEFIRFLVTGSINTAASWAVYLLVLQFAPYTVAYTCAHLFGIVFTYYLSTRWVFKVEMSWKTFLQFPLIYVIRYAVDLTLIIVWVKVLGLWEEIAPIAALVISMPLGFVLSRWLLKAQPAPEH